jgi:hypothetical protein
MKASPDIDIWSFGVLLFTLVSGCELFLVNRDDDIQNGTNDHPAMFTDKDIQRKILRSIPLTFGADASLVRDLLMKCLMVDPTSRIPCMDIILEDPFFTGSFKLADIKALLSQQTELMKTLQQIDETTRRIEKNTIQIQEISLGMTLQLKKTETILLRGMFEATEVQSPSCFIILNQKLVPSHLSDTGAELPKDKVKSAERWFHKLGQLGNAVDAAVAKFDSALKKITNSPSEIITDALESLWKGEELWLYLIDERTMKPVIPEDDSVYPIQITTPKEWIPKLAPLLKVSLKAIRTLNTVSGFAHCLGLPTPVLTSETISSIETAVGQITKESSVEEYELLHDLVVETSKANELSPAISNSISQGPAGKAVRGEALREFERFLVSHDKERKFAGLKRFPTVEGFACWTTEEGKEEIIKEAKTEEKTDFRKVENSVNIKVEIGKIENPVSKKVEARKIENPVSKKVEARKIENPLNKKVEAGKVENVNQNKFRFLRK